MVLGNAAAAVRMKESSYWLFDPSTLMLQHAREKLGKCLKQTNKQTKHVFCLLVAF